MSYLYAACIAANDLHSRIYLDVPVHGSVSIAKRQKELSGILSKRRAVIGIAGSRFDNSTLPYKSTDASLLRPINMATKKQLFSRIENV